MESLKSKTAQVIALNLPTYPAVTLREEPASTLIPLSGGKIKLFARRKRTVKLDPNSEFV